MFYTDDSTPLEELYEINEWFAQARVDFKKQGRSVLRMLSFAVSALWGISIKLSENNQLLREQIEATKALQGSLVTGVTVTGVTAAHTGADDEITIRLPGGHQRMVLIYEYQNPDARDKSYRELGDELDISHMTVKRARGWREKHPDLPDGFWEQQLAS